MARTITEIQNLIIQDIQNNEILSNKITSKSKTAIWRLWTYIVATAIWTLEKLFDIHKSEVETIINSKSPHRLLWYKNKALSFQYGYSLLSDSDIYEIEDDDAKIIKYAAATEIEGILRIKVAKENSGLLAELSSEEITAFSYYMNMIKDAGVILRIISQEADHLKLSIDIYYDPMVLDGEGRRLDGTNNTPVQSAITNYLQNLPFDGEFTIMSLTDIIQSVSGVKIVQIINTEAKWGTYDWNIISARYNPEAGWLKIYDNDLTINWIAYGANL
jgi:hypothetical protein